MRLVVVCADDLMLFSNADEKRTRNTNGPLPQFSRGEGRRNE
jgi:hypothetical protein